MTALQAGMIRYRLPLVAPIKVNRHTLLQREAIILSLQQGDRIGYGEIAPLIGFSRETLAQAEHQLTRMLPSLEANEVNVQHLDQYCYPSVACGISAALWWLSQPVWASTAPTNAPLLQGELAAILQRLQQWQGDFPALFKVKTGRHVIKEDIGRIQAILDVLPLQVLIKLDANRQWSSAEVLALAKAVDVNRIAYIEEPTDNPKDFQALYQHSGIRFALDESLQQPDYQFQPLQGLAALVIKPMLVGSLPRCISLLQQGQQAGIESVLSSSYESPLGLRILQQLSQQYVPTSLAGLDTLRAFAAQALTESPFDALPTVL